MMEAETKKSGYRRTVTYEPNHLSTQRLGCMGWIIRILRRHLKGEEVSHTFE